MTSNVTPLTRPGPPRLLRIGSWLFEIEACRLLREAEESRLTPKTAAVLLELAAAPGEVVTRETLFEKVWPRGEPSQDLLNHAIKELRRALGDDLKAPSYIETIPKVGYRLIAAVSPYESTAPRGAVLGFPHRGGGSQEPRRLPVALWAACAVLMALVVAIPLARRSDERGTGRSGVPALREVRFATAEPGEEAWPRLAPDGGFIAYTGPTRSDPRLRLYVRAVDGTHSVRISRELEGGPYDEHFPVWSPDGANIAFVRLRDEDGDCRINVVSALGGVERNVFACRTHTIDYFDWSPDGRLLAVTSDSVEAAGGPGQIALVDIESGAVRHPRYGPTSAEHDLDPRFSPDGRWIAFRRGAAPFSDLWVMPAEGGTARRLTHLGGMIRGHDWLPDSAGLVFSSDHGGAQSLYALRLSDRRLTPLGETDAYFPDVAARRARVVFQRFSGQSRLSEYSLVPDTPKLRDVALSSADDGYAQYGPDGRIVFVSTRSGQPAIWLYEPDTDASRMIARHPNVKVLRPRWSPDGTRVSYSARAGNEAAVYVVEIGNGTITRVNPEGVSGRYGEFTPDGASLVYSEEHPGGWRVVRRSLRDRDDVEALPGSEGGSDPWLSRDGRYAYFTKVTGTGLFRLDLTTGESIQLTDEIAYRNMDSWIVCPEGVLFLGPTAVGKPGIYRIPLEGGPATLLRMLPEPLHGIALSLAPEGDRVIVSERVREDADLVLAEIQ